MEHGYAMIGIRQDPERIAKMKKATPFNLNGVAFIE